MGLNWRTGRVPPVVIPFHATHRRYTGPMSLVVMPHKRAFPHGGTMDISKETLQYMFVRVLRAETKWATILVASGFSTLEEVAYVPIGEFRSIDGLSEQQIQDCRTRARRRLLVEEIGGGDEEDPLVVATVKRSSSKVIQSSHL